MYTHCPSKILFRVGYKYELKERNQMVVDKARFRIALNKIVVLFEVKATTFNCFVDIILRFK